MIHPNRIWDAKKWFAVPPGLSAILKGGCAMPLPLGSAVTKIWQMSWSVAGSCGKPCVQVPNFSSFLNDPSYVCFDDIQAHTFRTNILPTRVTVFSPTLSLLTSRPHCLGLWWLTPWALALGEETPIQIDDCGFTRWFLHPEQVLLIRGRMIYCNGNNSSYAAKWVSDLVLRYLPASKNPHGWFVGIWNDLRSYSL